MGALIFKMVASRFVDVSEEHINSMKENLVPRGTKDASKSGLTLFESMILKFCKLTAVEMFSMSIII